MGPAPDCPKLFLSKLKSAILMVLLPSKSALASYPVPPLNLPNVFFSMLKSPMLTVLLLSQSPVSCTPPSKDEEAPEMVRLPLVARYPGDAPGGGVGPVVTALGPFTRQA